MDPIRWLSPIVLFASACSPGTIGDLSRPALVVIITEPGAFCAETIAVDADDVVWTEEGCGSSNGLERQPAVDVDRAALDAQMDAVLELSNDADCEAPGPSAYRYRFDRTLPGTDDWPSVRQCDPGVPLVALDLVDTMRRLASPQSDAGTDAGL